jgi:hypothetical protein
VISASAASADGDPTSLCTPTEEVMFHCSLGAQKAVSLCAERRDGALTALVYRESGPPHPALSWRADGTSGRRFSAASAPVSPRATVRQLWFVRDGLTYLLTQCVGGSCPHAAGLAVLRGDTIVSDERCRRTADDRAWFAPSLVAWGGDTASSRSLTSLVAMDDVDNDVERLYRAR